MIFIKMCNKLENDKLKNCIVGRCKWYFQYTATVCLYNNVVGVSLYTVYLQSALKEYCTISVISPGLIQLHKFFWVDKQKIFDKEALF